MSSRSRISRRPRKRPAAFVKNDESWDSPSAQGKDNTEQIDADYLCSVCLDIIHEAHMTKCGHSFCYDCITRSLQDQKSCPRCAHVIDGEDQIFPNFTLNELALKYREKDGNAKKSKLSDIDSESEIPVDQLGLDRVNHWLNVLQQRKEILEHHDKRAHVQLTIDFLIQLEEQKAAQLHQLKQEVTLIQDDLAAVRRELETLTSHPVPGRGADSLLEQKLPNGTDAVSSCQSSESGYATNNTDTHMDSSSDVTSEGQDGFNGSKSVGLYWFHSSLASRRKRVCQHFDDLQACYLSHRLHEAPAFSAEVPEDDVMKQRHSLSAFTDKLAKFTRFNQCRPLATLNYANDIYNTSSIVSSIEFDRDCEYFAIAGVTKKIKIFEYGSVISNASDVHYPVNEMVGNSKISSVVWSTYHKGRMASSDYEGTVTLWEAFTGTKTRVFQEHEKRCWSLDFNHMDPKVLASGSDDAKVKLWCTSSEHSIANIEAKANVCCVKFSPNSQYNLAFGSADHCVHYYDLRALKRPLKVFKGHRKAVSYTKFVTPDELVSASTDSQLKLWDVNDGTCRATFTGHVNDKNFVGLATDGNYIACGSENNSLYIYYKGLTKQLLTFKFDNVRGVLDQNRPDEESSEFVSAVSWRAGSNVVVAANSQGIIKVLELV